MRVLTRVVKERRREEDEVARLVELDDRLDAALRVACLSRSVVVQASYGHTRAQESCRVADLMSISPLDSVSRSLSIDYVHITA